MRVLARALQECAVAKAKNPFIIVPDDTDLAALLDDVDRYTASEIAGLLIILSTLHYPRGTDAGSDLEMIAAATLTQPNTHQHTVQLEEREGKAND